MPITLKKQLLLTTINNWNKNTRNKGVRKYPPTPAGFTSLPLQPVQRLLYVGDSYIERGGATYTPSGVLQGGITVQPNGLWGIVAAARKRFDSSVFINASKPYGTLKLDGAEQGLSGTGVLDARWADRIDYCLARNPGLIVFDIMKNDCNQSPLANTQSIKDAFMVAYNKCFAAKVWIVVCTQAAFRQGASPGDWSSSGANQLQLNDINAWIKSTVKNLPGVNGTSSPSTICGVPFIQE